ncbi:hypothetical protein MKK67_12090 [Methylobacterium sp. J-072]|uniref:hypothetical protein n=1 Tax=Methylobacterium sp. J-072 TaxID=2836651 RepID=UPI001FBB65EB|nr:hypothetical protein [Methylobacterium sp. J-072]MCJ2093224.1 hypothetical protein [Methylobacterium sp. J-072]
MTFLLPHLRGDDAECDSALNAVLTALYTAHAEGLRRAARFCRTVADGAVYGGDWLTAGIVLAWVILLGLNGGVDRLQ